jgi:glycosyltransferase involved in cell wall biosynthesis
MHLGLVTCEFFDAAVGRMGGFGFASRSVIRCFQRVPEAGVKVTTLAGEERLPGERRVDRVHGVPLVPYDHDGRKVLIQHCRAIRRVKADMLLTIDYRPSYDRIFLSLPRTPIAIWVRDPWTPEDQRRIATVRVPGDDAPARGTGHPNTTQLSRIARLAKLTRRRLAFVSPAPHLVARVEGTYGVPLAELPLLPNIIAQPTEPPRKSARPSVVFLGRLDPIKRPWVMAEIGRRMPDVDVYLLGQPHYAPGPGVWTPTDLPLNVKLMGHVDGPRKAELLDAAWLLVNTSIHEGLAISFLEALAHRTPVVAGLDPDGVVSRYGIYVGDYLGDGMASVDAYVTAIRALIDDPGRRARLGEAGQAWVAATHNHTNFLRQFGALCERLRVRLPVTATLAEPSESRILIPT